MARPYGTGKYLNKYGLIRIMLRESPQADIDVVNRFSAAFPEFSADFGAIAAAVYLSEFSGLVIEPENDTQLQQIIDEHHAMVQDVPKRGRRRKKK